MSASNPPMLIPSKRAWNNGRIIGQKRALLPKHVWAIRVRLELAGSARDLTLFNLAIDGKLRGWALGAWSWVVFGRENHPAFADWSLEA